MLLGTIGAEALATVIKMEIGGNTSIEGTPLREKFVHLDWKGCLVLLQDLNHLLLWPIHLLGYIQ